MLKKASQGSGGIPTSGGLTKLCRCSAESGGFGSAGLAVGPDDLTGVSQPNHLHHPMLTSPPALFDHCVPASKGLIPRHLKQLSLEAQLSAGMAGAGQGATTTCLIRLQFSLCCHLGSALLSAVLPARWGNMQETLASGLCFMPLERMGHTRKLS